MASCKDASCCSAAAKHLVVVGGGSAAFAATLSASAAGWRVTMVHSGRLPIGGTCVNVGCVPSKTLIRAAEVAHHASSAGALAFAGIEASSRVVDFGAVIAQKAELVRQLRQQKYVDVVSELPRFELVEGEARVVDSTTVSVAVAPPAAPVAAAAATSETAGGAVAGAGPRTLKADMVVVATGAAPHAAPFPGLDSVEYLTSESAFELQTLPTSLIVLGGRFVALECAQMFARMGSRVTVLQRAAHLLPAEAEDVSDGLAKHLAAEGIRVVTSVAVEQVRRAEAGAAAEVVARVGGGEAQTFSASHILVATGHRANTAAVRGLHGVEFDDHGNIRVDEFLRTGVPGVFAAGDVIGDPAFVYTAAYEGALAAENAVASASGTALRARDYGAVPWVVFTDPQVAGVGWDEREAAARGVPVDVSVVGMEHVPRCLAARDTRGFVKLLRNRQTHAIVGARVVAPEGAELLMEVSLAIKHKLTSEELAAAFHPYLTLSEAIKLAAISFDTDVAKLSCCAS